MLPIKYAFFCKVIITPKCSYRKLGCLLVYQMTAKCTSIDHDNNLRPGADKEDGGGSRDIHVVPPPPPVPPSPLVPSAGQRVGSPLGGRVHRGGDLPLSSSTSVDSTSIPVDSTSTPVEPFLPPGKSSLPPGNSPGKSSLPPDVDPLPGCSDPLFCVNGRDHRRFLAPGGSQPSRKQVEWATLR